MRGEAIELGDRFSEGLIRQLHGPMSAVVQSSRTALDESLVILFDGNGYWHSELP